MNSTRISKLILSFYAWQPQAVHKPSLACFWVETIPTRPSSGKEKIST